MAKCVAMAAGTPPKSAQQAWNDLEVRIGHLVSETLSLKSGSQSSKKNYDVVFDAVRNYFFSHYSENPWLPSIVDREVATFVRETRQQLWNAHKAFVISNLQESLPPAASEFESYYIDVFLRKLFIQFSEHAYPESWRDDRFEEELKLSIMPTIAHRIVELTNDRGELRDEELVRLHRAGYEKCRTMLLERYATKLHDLTPRIIHVKNLCPSVEDATQYAKDVAQEVSLKLVQKIDSYKLDSQFETWVGSIIENEARTLGTRKYFGRAKAGPRTYVSFEDLEQELAAPEIPIIENREHREILHKALQKHRAGGKKDAKSADAIELRYFDELETPEVAKRIGATESYVAKLFSDDYPKVWQILVDDFGITGTEL